MTEANIIRAVRLCYDEEAVNASSLVTGLGYADDNALMDNIIKSKIGDALRWVCLYAPADLLAGTDEENGGQEVDTGIMVDAELSEQIAADGGVELVEGADCLKLKMPSNFIRLARVRILGWHKAVKTPISEDSEEYLQLYDTNGATATDDRPVAALIEKSRKEIELWPSGEEESYRIEVSFIVSTEGSTFTTGSGTSQETHYALPPKARTAFIYYLAFLTLSAYEDSRAARMLEIAKMNLGK